MKLWSKTTLTPGPRAELHDAIGLTGAEVSLNQLPAGGCVPFVHAHKQNEEIYGILSGKGSVVIDGERIPLGEGDWLRIAPKANRQFFAAEDSQITFVCIQVKEHSLEQYTMGDVAE